MCRARHRGTCRAILAPWHAGPTVDPHPHARTQRHRGRLDRPRHDDVRRVGQHRRGRVPAHGRRRDRRRRHAVRHRRHLRRRRVRADPRHGRCADGATVSCWRRRSATRWAATPSAAGCPGAGSPRPATTACAASASTTSTCTSCTAPTRPHRSVRRSRSSASSSRPARCVPSARRRSRPCSCATRSTRRPHSASPSRSASSRRTRLLARGIERDVLPLCRTEGIGVRLLGAAQRWLAHRQVPAGRRRPGQPGEPAGRALRPQGRGACGGRSWPPSTSSAPSRRRRPDAPAAGAGLRPRRPDRHGGDHRPAHARPAHRAAGGRARRRSRPEPGSASTPSSPPAARSTRSTPG